MQKSVRNKNQTVEKHQRCQLVNCSQPLASLRALKDPQELRLLQRAASLGSKGFDHLLAHIKPGVSELDLAKTLKIFWLQEGGEGCSFDPIIAFGANAAKPHHMPSKKRLAVGDPVLIDIGVTLEKYHSDMTRVVFFRKATRRMREVYAIVAEAQQQALALCCPGENIAAIDRVAREFIASHGYGDAFCHSLGHGIGLQVHEWPFLRNNATTRKEHLQEGMVITIEPGIYLPGIGGVRIEDTVAITAKGYRNLTQRPKELLIV